MSKVVWIMNHYATNTFEQRAGRHYWMAKYLKTQGYSPVIFCANVPFNKQESIDHDCSIGDFVHISPGVSIGGTTKIGSGTRIGIGASVKNNIHILENVVLGAGACVVSNIKKPGIYIGVPAKLKG